MIVLKNIKKKYSSKEKKYIGRYFIRNIIQSIWDALRRKPDNNDGYVLKGIDLNIQKGEQVGLIGKNKAGKSTLLQLISGISEPSSGQMEISGKIIPVFGQGSISTPDLTGREYIYLYAAALGSSKKQIQAIEQQIIDFSEITEIDTPVKFYSTGTRTRLSLAVTLLLPADIYILDEVFYGSDIFFKEKTAARLQELIADPEKTMILVSHHEEIILQYCTRLLLLDNGVIIKDGDPHTVLAHYKALYSENSNFPPAA